MVGNRINWKLTILLLLGTLFILFPLYLTITVAFKTPQEMTGNLLALPESWSFDNFIQAIEMTNFFGALGNSVFVTLVTVVLVLLTHSLVAYAIARNMHKKFYKFLYFYFISAMFIPFPIIMLPLVKQTSMWGMDNIIGLSILNAVMHLAFNVFIYVGFIKTIPKELEEAAIIDGATTWQVFWKVIFPLMKPMHATVAILTALAAWNDFMLPLVILSDSSQYTLPLVQYAFQGQFSTDYNLAFASYLMAILPMLIVYIFAQKWIIGGVMRGSIK
ncbi:carbohydrate ABC transporter permease [Mesobacillus maritimus]|uniref:carbohydrate ABC transporter permease n=1 Tax=Mesobacillus maritimus TaxID=1643336 RepID=UPI00203F41A5|nr:carbohydrate ABC transporter permease [Mesobacillus maritimus]MCM3584612.1 carbohydrate ABC transporter permease [Mesobacillus maritimus]MCM3671410.1 carbohydrate ABC transporter permease [Mesobacillus maritimus]